MREGKRSLRFYPCADCGTWCLRWRYRRQPLVCPQCGIERASEVARQIHYRNGPWYDKWKEAGGANTWPLRRSKE